MAARAAPTLTRFLVPAAVAAGLVGLASAPSAGGARSATIVFEVATRGRLVITAPAYRLTLSRRNGGIVEVVDRASGARLVRGSLGCLWAAVPADGDASIGGCSLGRGGRGRVGYRWSPGRSTLTLTYDADDGAARRVEAVAELTARESSFDLALTLENHWGRPLETVLFPADLRGDAASIEAAYAPSFLPGVKLGPGFFSRISTAVLTYPSRWAWADFLAYDAGGGHLALYAVNPPPSAIAPVSLGFVHTAAPDRCSGGAFCLVHAFQTWIPDGGSWRSPRVRVLVGRPVEEAIRAYRADSGVEQYPSLADKLGDRLAALARAPLVKADLWKGLPSFREWAADLRRLPSPALIHPVAYQPRGHDESHPDFLPPDPRWGTTADFRTAVEQAHALGHSVMPYLNVSWWNPTAPTMSSLPPLGPADVAVRNRAGEPVLERYGSHEGYVVSPYSPIVRQRVAALVEEWQQEVPVDCLFFDQIGARPWLRDFHPASPTPLAYADGWLEALAPYAGRCLMAEDGWDRLARDWVGFHGSVVLMERAFPRAPDSPSRLFGEGSWEPYPLALWLLRDKVLMYQHDLYEGTMTADPEVLAWNALFGFQLSYAWDGSARTLDSPWLDVVGAFQQALGPRTAGLPLAGWRELAPGVREAVYGDVTVTASLGGQEGFAVNGYGIPADGFLARARDGSLVAGVFTGSFAGRPLSEGTHFLVVERDAGGVTVRQPLGSDTELAVEPPSGASLRVEARSREGRPLGTVAAELVEGWLVFRYRAELDGTPVASYRVTPA